MVGVEPNEMGRMLLTGTGRVEFVGWVLEPNGPRRVMVKKMGWTELVGFVLQPKGSRRIFVVGVADWKGSNKGW